MKLPKSMKKLIKEERKRIVLEMQEDGTTQADWERLSKKYWEYDRMLKPTFTISPDTILVVGGNLAGILLILNYEKMNIVTSKALSFVLKGRV